MSKKQCIVGIDVGTTNTKVCIFQLPDFERIVIDSFETTNDYSNGQTNFDAEEIWSKIKNILMKTLPPLSKEYEITSISIASFAQTIVLQNHQGEVLPPTIAWFDSRSKEEVNEVNARVGPEKLYEITGLNAHSNHSLTKLLWIKNHLPQVYRSIFKWTCMSGFIASRLTGNYATDESLASRTMAFDINTRQWSTFLMEQFDLDVNTFPDVVESGVPIGNVHSDFTQQMGIPDDILVSISGHDHMAGSVCTNLLEETELLNSTGTTEGLLLLNKTSNTSNHFRASSISNGLYVMNNLYSFYGSMPTAGQSFRWYSELFSKNFSDVIKECESLLQTYDSDYHSLLDTMFIFIPHLRGSGPPERNIKSKALMVGFDDTSTNKDVLFSLTAGLCFELKQLKEAYENHLGKSIETIKVIGPASKNPFWLQMKADVLNANIHVYEIEEAVAKGAAVLAALKQQIISHIPEPGYTIFKPLGERNEKLEAVYTHWYLPSYEMKKSLERRN